MAHEYTNPSQIKKMFRLLIKLSSLSAKWEGEKKKKGKKKRGKKKKKKKKKKRKKKERGNLD